MREDTDVFKPIDRGLPLVATWTRWLASAAAVGAGFLLAAVGTLAITHSQRTLSSLAGPVAIACALEGLLLLSTFRAEESRLSRELRTARTGTPALRGMVASQRQHLPFLARHFSTPLGAAAVLLADGDRSAALDLLASGSVMMRGGRLDKLRAIVDADLDRATGSSASLERCVQELRAMDRIGNREADLYRIHVMVKAILEQGDTEAALELADELSDSTDDEERTYLTWLHVWFDFDALDADAPATSPTEAETRMATLVARAHGAERLVEKLEARIAAIARPERRE
jgi:hypothetical protein